MIVWIIVYLAMLLFVGYLGNRSTKKSHESGKTTWANEFFTGARSFGPLVLAFTFAATYASGGTFIGHPGLGYANGLMWSWGYTICLWCAFLPFMILGKRVFRVSKKIQALSIADVIEYRYENNIVVAILLIIMTVFFYMAYIVSQLAAAATLMSAALEISYRSALVIFTTVLIIYVTISGMRGVAWADTIQGFIMILFVLSIIPMMAHYAGGIGTITSTIQETKPQLLRGGGPGTATAIGFMISFLFVTTAQQGMGQPAALQRLIIYDDLKSFRWGTLLSGVLMMLMTSIMIMAGSFGNALFPGIVPDTVIPTVITTVFPTVLASFCVAAILAGVNTSANSYMLCVSTSITKDLVMDYLKKDMTESQVNTATKVVTALTGIVGLFLAFNPPEFIGLFILYAWRGLGLGIGIPLIFGCLWKRANKYGALSSMAVSVIVYLWLHMAKINVLGMGLDVSTWGLIAGMITMVVVSLATAPTKPEVLRVFFEKGE